MASAGAVATAIPITHNTHTGNIIDSIHNFILLILTNQDGSDASGGTSPHPLRIMW